MIFMAVAALEQKLAYTENLRRRWLERSRFLRACKTRGALYGKYLIGRMLMTFAAETS
jgi:hypothetical protein